MPDPTIPFGPDADPLGLTATDFEFVDLADGGSVVENSSVSTKKNGEFLREAGTRIKNSKTANYIVLKSTAVLPDLGYDTVNEVWLDKTSQPKPKEGDWTLAVDYHDFDVVTNQEMLPPVVV